MRTTTTSRSRRRLTAAALAAAAFAVAAPAAHAAPDGPVVPATIAVPSGHKVFLVAHAEGVQIYSCNPKESSFEWQLVAPRATLRNEQGKVIGTHDGGPTWHALDGSSVMAARDGTEVVPNAIPWLRLKKTSATAGADGDRLTATTYIQRTGTVGGVAPHASECNSDTVGTRVEIAYTADYHFWKAI